MTIIEERYYIDWFYGMSILVGLYYMNVPLSTKKNNFHNHFKLLIPLILVTILIFKEHMEVKIILNIISNIFI